MSRLAYLEGLRGIAAVIVVMNHIVVSFFPALYNGDPNQAHYPFEVIVANTPLTIVYGGNFAVSVFFVLSGYVLTYAQLRKASKPRILVSVTRRYIRLTIPVLVSCLLGYLFIACGWMFNRDAAGLTFSSWWLDRMFPNIADIGKALADGFGRVYWQMGSDYNPVLWTMSVEMIGSVGIFVLLKISLLQQKRKLSWLVWLAIGICLMNTYYFCFLAGILICKADMEDLQGLLLYRSWVPLLLLGVWLGSFPFTQKISSFYEPLAFLFSGMTRPGHSARMVGAIIVVYAVVFSPQLQGLFSKNWLVKTGRISFSMYLLHTILLCSFMCYVFLILYPAYGYGWAFAVSFLIFGIVLVVTAYFMTVSVDYFGKKVADFTGEKLCLFLR